MSMIFKCKMCGGDLEIKENSTVCECEYCGTTQTLPKIDNDRRANLYDRANHFRRNNEFDKAMGIYEQILNDDGSDAEAYWSIVLCRYGIEYVEDPTTHKRVPTVNRAQFTSIFDDANYQSAIEHADSAQREVYKAEAEAINEIQKGILEISSKEEPFDVFICYKETDNNGRRTPDSVLANDLYHQLTQEGFKVFFARITLEDKLGSAYEPYIFAALNSAKVMVVLGTKPEYFNAVWVKNEWSRYLALIKSGAKKMLIPAYKDMDPYDLPEEFSHLQAQDMAKLGFMQDLIRGIKKITAVDEPKAVKQETVVVQSEGNSNITALLKRAKMALEDSEFAKADDFCEQVLNQDAENAEAYLYKLYAEFEIGNRDKFRTTAKNADNIKKSKNFAKACKFGMQAQLDEDINEILYNQAAREEEKAHSEEDYKSAAKCFREIAGYKDSAARVKNCIEKGKRCVYQNAEKAFASANNEEAYNKVAELYRHVSGYKDAAEKAEKAIEAGKECAYQIAEKAYEKADNEEAYNKAADLYHHVSGYKDADEKAVKAIEAGKEYAYQLAEKAFENANNKESYNKAAELYRHISGYKDAYEKRNICVEKASECNKEEKYNKANNFASLGNFDSLNQAATIFESLSGWKDSAERAEKCKQRIKEKEEEQLRKAEQKRIAVEKEAQRRKKVTIIVSCVAVVVIIAAFVISNAIHKKSLEIMRLQLPVNTISANSHHTVGLKSNGTVVAVGENENGQCDVSDWTDIVAVSTSSSHTIGIRADGTVVAVGADGNGKCGVSDWTDIVAVASGGTYTVGLKADGTVVAVGIISGENDVSDWKDIIAVSAFHSNIVGLKSDGTVVAVGQNDYGQCNVSDWTDIVAVDAGGSHTVGLKADGTVVAVGANGWGQCNVSDWTDIVAVDASVHNTVGLKSDGTVVAVCYNNYGQCNVSDWTDIAVHN